MKLSQFSGLLQANPDKQFHLVLPGFNTVPVSFHVTEVGHVTKKFIDCGGRLHAVQSCQLQVWLGTDTGHRLSAGKMAGVLNLAQGNGVLPEGQDLDIEFEYEDTLLSQYSIESYSAAENAVVFHLASKHTDCLAKEGCLPQISLAAGAVPAGCCGTSCDC